MEYSKPVPDRSDWAEAQSDLPFSEHEVVWAEAQPNLPSKYSFTAQHTAFEHKVEKGRTCNGVVEGVGVEGGGVEGGVDETWAGVPQSP